jgi:hypothetical protein
MGTGPSCYFAFPILKFFRRYDYRSSLLRQHHDRFRRSTLGGCFGRPLGALCHRSPPFTWISAENTRSAESRQAATAQVVQRRPGNGRRQSRGQAVDHRQGYLKRRSRRVEPESIAVPLLPHAVPCRQKLRAIRTRNIIGPNETEISHGRVSWQGCSRSLDEGPLASSTG